LTPTAASPRSPWRRPRSALLCAHIVGNELAADNTQNHTFSQHGMAARIGVDDPRARIDQNMPALMPSTVSAKLSASPVLRSITGDQRASTNMRDDQPHAPTRLFVSRPIPLVPKNTKQGGARR